MKNKNRFLETTRITYTYFNPFNPINPIILKAQSTCLQDLKRTFLVVFKAIFVIQCFVTPDN